MFCGIQILDSSHQSIKTNFRIFHRHCSRSDFFFVQNQLDQETLSVWFASDFGRSVERQREEGSSHAHDGPSSPRWQEPRIQALYAPGYAPRPGSLRHPSHPARLSRLGASCQAPPQAVARWYHLADLLQQAYRFIEIISQWWHCWIYGFWATSGLKFRVNNSWICVTLLHKSNHYWCEISSPMSFKIHKFNN